MAVSCLLGLDDPDEIDVVDGQLGDPPGRDFVLDLLSGQEVLERDPAARRDCRSDCGGAFRRLLPVAGGLAPGPERAPARSPRTQMTRIALFHVCHLGLACGPGGSDGLIQEVIRLGREGRRDGQRRRSGLGRGLDGEVLDVEDPGEMAEPVEESGQVVIIARDLDGDGPLGVEVLLDLPPRRELDDVQPGVEGQLLDSPQDVRDLLLLGDDDLELLERSCSWPRARPRSCRAPAFLASGPGPPARASARSARSFLSSWFLGLK